MFPRSRLPCLADHAILTVGALVMGLPIYSLFVGTTYAPGNGVGLGLVPGPDAIRNYTNLLTAHAGFTDDITALGMLWNSFLLGAGFAGLKVALSLLSAYALVYFHIRFAPLIFWLLLLTLLLPLESRFLPTYDIVAGLGLTNTRSGLILPLVASGMGTLFFRQFLQTVPDTLLEAARLDGAGPFRFFRDVLVPLSLPTAGALFLVVFVNGWNQYLWPVMVTSQESTYTVVRGLQFFGANSLSGKMLAVLAILPPAVLVILFQRQVVKGLYDGAH